MALAINFTLSQVEASRIDMLAKQSRVSLAGQSSIREIRTRLLLLLLRAFVIVLFLSFLFFIIVAGYFLTSSPIPFHGQVLESSPSPFHAQLANSLEGYYLGHGSWEGVEVVFESSRLLK